MIKHLPILLLYFICVPVFGQVPMSSAAQGVELYLKNQPQAAVAFLEKALLEDPQNEKIYEYLGVSYQQLGQYDKAILVMKRGTTISLKNSDRLFLNIGNNYFLQQKYSFAEEMYTSSISTNRTFPGAYLNRALVRIKLEKYPDAISDYNMYLTLDPGSSQKGKILEHINILNTVINAEHRKKELAEQMQKELAAREQAFMNEVLNSLKTSSEDTKNLSAQSEGLQEYDDNLNIED